MPQWFEVAYRTLIAVITLFIMTKILGRRQVTQLSFFEYITGITIGSLAAYVSLDMDARWYLGIVAMGVWVGISYLLEVLTLRSSIVRRIIDGKPLVVIEKGNVVEKNLRKAKYSSADLLEQLRLKNVFAVADVEFAVLEVNGEISVYPKEDNRPVTLQILNKHTATKPPPHTVIVDGAVEETNLRKAGRDLHWLHKELQRKGVSLHEVFLAQVDSSGSLSIDKFDKRHKDD